MQLRHIFLALVFGPAKGDTCIWEPLSTWESFFDRQNRSNELLKLYDEISKKYIQKN